MRSAVINHRAMLSDRIRMNAYGKAIRKTVKKGDVVCDIGTGSGILAFLCLQAGAKKVYAIERNSIIKEAKKLARINKIDKRIVFLHKDSLNAKLPEKVDVLITETLGVFGIEENIQNTLIDAKRRFLKPKGKIIPSSLELFISPVECTNFWEKNYGLWKNNYYGMNFSSIFNEATTRRLSFNGKSEDLKIISSPKPVVSINFISLNKPIFSFLKTFTAQQSAHLHGLIGFFKARLCKGVNICTSPSRPRTHWQQSFFPLNDSYKIKKNDSIRIKVISLPFDQKFYWNWNVQIKRNDKTVARYSQSDFDFKSNKKFLQKDEDRPSLSIDGRISKLILGQFDGHKTVEAISRNVLKKFPSKFKNMKNAKAYVKTLMIGKTVKRPNDH